MRSSLRQVLFRSATGLDLNFAGGVFGLNTTRSGAVADIPGWSFSRTDTNGTATALDLAGNVIQFSTGAPRITNRGILVEEARTNLLPWSENASSGMSFNGGATFTANTGTSPDGTTTADTLALTLIGYAYAPTAAGQAIGTYTGSVWLRADAPTTVAIRLTRAALGANQTVLTASVTTSWQRFSLSLLTTGIDTLQFGLDQRTVVGGPGTAATVQIWGAQLELGAFATSPIITTGAAGTRAGDQPAGGTSVLTPEGTVIITYVVPPTAAGAAERLYGWRTEDSGNSRLALRIGDVGNNTAPAMVVGDGAAVTTITGANLTPGTTARVACSYSTLSAQAAMCVNGSDQTAVRQTATSMLSTLFQIGQSSGDFSATGPILRLQIIPRFLSAAERIALTAP